MTDDFWTSNQQQAPKIFNIPAKLDGVVQWKRLGQQRELLPGLGNDGWKNNHPKYPNTWKFSYVCWIHAAI